MKILVIGTGAREHALVRGLAQDPDVEVVIAAPGNPGMALVADCRPLPMGVLDGAGIADLAEELGADLVVVGPEAPLVAGVADIVRERGIACFGPSGEAAQLEGSKAFAKEVMAAADVPTARAYVCDTPDQVLNALDATGAPYVVKDDGLAAGKGVVVTDDHEAAVAHAQSILDAGSSLVIEEYLDGPEVSLFCISDGTTVRALEPAQDFKRVGDNDEGPNTGGMGAYSPLNWAPDGLVEDVVRRVAQPTIDEMRRRGTPFAGVLYVGLALTPRGPRVVEFNARFGDPETQVVLARLKSPLGALLDAAARGQLADHPELTWSRDAAVTVVVASDGYPTAPRTGDAIAGLDDLVDAYVLHAGTAQDADGALVSAGGRVLSVVAVGQDLAQARQRAYAAVEQVELAGSHHRTDIALKAERGEITV
ncbi:phosphoribosylamine--glycine ligase [Luteipulveratus mongoliensis]|uniref:Phosphoribosylamine--glycine ligase n=1 Tax=Luteipulveratus mongoliensis TaxID=571913 RepID=A0A0K1JFT0_9MICO|nr:phosphoribosylamine--glycine ligase [Luteipulveratus mongoliensis]AKU15564.1 phosphoribosylamine--glycine ligase [Luteipulveratus mongoliensis]